MIVVDTHAWVWWVSEPEKLSQKARSVLDRAMAGNAIYISSISVWEVALLCKKGRLQLNTSVNAWVAETERLRFFTFVPVSNSIALRSIDLPEDFHNDQADRIIISTALELDLPVVTKDRRILNCRIVKAIW